MPKIHIKSLSLEELGENLISAGYRAFHAKQILSWIYQKGAQSFDTMSDLSRELRKYLTANFIISALKLIKELESKDGTKKLLFQLQDNNYIESVIIPVKDRVTGCISSQVGCKFACKFCASGLRGFRRNLSSAEMLDEVSYIKELCLNKKLTHIVFMGSGEPLDNYDNLLGAIRIINSHQAFNIGARRITISTCGIVPGIKRLLDEDLQVELSISLHAADDKTRSYLIPLNKKYPLKEVISACKEYINKTNRQITFEYVLIRGVNSDLQNAKNLATILKGLRLVKVNLIPANPVKEFNLEPPAKLDILLFKDHLVKTGISVTLRKPRGEDIEAACGQLRLRYEKKQ